MNIDVLVYLFVPMERDLVANYRFIKLLHIVFNFSLLSYMYVINRSDMLHRLEMV